MVLIVIVGPMFSGKTTELIRLVERQVIAGRKAIVIKPSIDDRYHSSKVMSHSGWSWEAVQIPIDKVDEIPRLAEKYKVLAIDEVQFFVPSLAEILNELANEKIVIAAGLNLDFKGVPFETTMKIMAYADKVISLTAVCKVCGRPATRSQRLIHGKPAPRDSPRILIGGAESYEARCRKHHIVP
jgi:thymidine kinase